MGLTGSQALEILSRIVFINEQARTLLINCIKNEMYDDDGDFREFIFDNKDFLATTVQIIIDYPDAVRVAKQISEQAKEDDLLAYYLDANKILADIKDLNRYIKRQNKQ